MRILLVTNNYFPYCGGVVSSIEATTKQLRAQGHEVFILTLDFESNRPADPDYVYRLWCPIKFRYKTNHMALPVLMGIQIDAYIAEKKPDIVHVHHPFLLGPKAAKSARYRGIPVLFTYHTLYEAYAHYVPLPESLVEDLARSLSVAFCNTVDGVIAPSSAMSKYLKDNGVATDIRVIASSVDERFFMTHGKSYTDRDRRSLRLLVVSRFVPEKNVSLALDMFAQLPQDGSITLTLVGYGSQWESIQLYAYRELKLSAGLVTFIFKPSKDDLVALYRQADIFLFTSSTDTQGLVIVEAMASGCPVVSVDGPGQQDSIVNGVNGFIVDDAIAMAGKIMQLAADSTQLASLSAHARHKAQEYRAQGLVQQLVAFYKELLGPKNTE